jgi:DNA-binding NtrC family response regulator
MKSQSDCSANAILLLDDEFDITSSFKQGLEDKGYNVFGFTDPLLALDDFQMNSERYGLVISDIRMPEISGYEFIKKVKDIKPIVKVFLMTAFRIDDIEDRRELPFIKVDEFIQKPILLEDFTSAVSKHFNN